ncbi:hypothetical protein NDU88_007153 [Pleurodeles waltl]|uniref:Uncharacterized protein n=1 Tax=Pleurodeles waltl TaxID=8319 RepID=A0AAV7QNW1_PLEWA|nr:hypothetical protein NDU88_007153 [Pleurodeles waltl]
MSGTPGGVRAEGAERRVMDADWTRAVTRPPETTPSKGEERRREQQDSPSRHVPFGTWLSQVFVCVSL